MNTETIQDLYDAIAADKDRIIDSGKQGSDKAKTVMHLHRMCVKSADVPTVTFLREAYRDWLEENPRPRKRNCVYKR